MYYFVVHKMQSCTVMHLLFLPNVSPPPCVICARSVRHDSRSTLSTVIACLLFVLFNVQLWR